MEILKSKAQVDALVQRYLALREDLGAILQESNEAEDAEQIERLKKELSSQIDCIENTLDFINPMIEDEDGNVLPRPKVGNTVKVYRPHHDSEIVTGTIIEDDGDEITVEVPEVIIPPKPQTVIPGFTATANWEEEHGQWVDWSESEEAEEPNE